MAIVLNKDGQGILARGHTTGPVDRSYAVPTTSGAGVPSVASIFASQLHLNQTTFELYRAMETGTTTWVKL